MGRPRKPIRCERIPGTDRFRIGYLEEPCVWHHTPATSESEALRYAYKHKGEILSRSKKILNLAKYAENFFSPTSSWVVRQRDKGHVFSDPYLTMRDGHVRNYLSPAFGAEDPRTLTRRFIDDKIIAMKKPSGAALAPATKYKINATMAILLDDLVDQGVIAANPMEGLRPYSKSPVKPRTAIPREAFFQLFPDTHGGLVKVWRTPMWAALMCCFKDTGDRPGELLALRWGEFHEKDRAFVIRHGVKAGTKNEIGSTKTGIVKPALLTTRTTQELIIWRSQSNHAQDMDFIFTLDGEAPVTGAAARKVFRAALAHLGISGQPWTPYYMRHSFATYNMATLDKEELIMLMGHSTILQTLTYEHPDDQIVIASAETARGKLDRAREPEAEED